MSKIWKSCEKCGKKTKNIRIFKREYLCYNCFVKNTNNMRLKGENLIFNEPIKRTSIINLNLTETQDKLLFKRLEYLFPYKNHHNGKKTGISEYIRGLILADLEIWEKMEKEK